MIRIAIAAGLFTAGLAGAGVAEASPGVAYDNGTGNPIHIGDTSAAGASAHATAGNKALAVSVFKPAVAEATDLAGGSTAIAVGVTKTASAITTGQNRSNNRIVAVNGTAGYVWERSTAPYTDDHDNTVIAVNGTTLIHGWNNVAISVNSDLEAKPIAEYGDGTHDYAAAWSYPLPLRVIAVGCSVTPGLGDLYNLPHCSK